MALALGGGQGQVRALCTEFHVDKSESNAAGKVGKRSILAIRADLQEKLKERGHRYISNHRRSAAFTTMRSVAEPAGTGSPKSSKHFERSASRKNMSMPQKKDGGTFSSREKVGPSPFTEEPRRFFLSQ